MKLLLRGGVMELTSVGLLKIGWRAESGEWRGERRNHSVTRLAPQCIKKESGALPCMLPHGDGRGHFVREKS